MEFLLVVLVMGGTFGLCFLADKGFTKLFRGSVQHKSGKSVRLSSKYGAFGAVLVALGIAAVFAGGKELKMLLFGGVVVLLVGVGLIVYYMTFGVYYDADTFLLSTFGKKSKVYRYADIQSQQLFTTAGGVLIELYLSDGRSLGLQASMAGTYPFLDHAFAAWCAQTGRQPEDCAFHDPENSLWFPTVEAR